MNRELYVNAEEGEAGKEKIVLLRSKIYAIGICIMFDTYLCDDDELVDSGEEWDYIEEQKKSLTCSNVKLLFLLFCYMLLFICYWNSSLQFNL